MSKLFEVVMVGIISGIVAITTSFLGIGGTVIGAVIGSMLYQIMSHFLKDPIEGMQVHEIEAKIVFIFPLLIIFVIELVYLLAIMNLDTLKIFLHLENFTNNNLFRLMGISLMIMGFYPLISSRHIRRLYATILSFLGLTLFLRGLIDTELVYLKLYRFIFTEFDFFIAIIILLTLLYIISYVSRDILLLFNEHKPHYSENSSKGLSGREKHLKKYLDRVNNKEIIDKINDKNYTNLKQDTNYVDGEKFNQNYAKKDFDSFQEDLDDICIKLDEDGKIKKFSDETSSSNSISSNYTYKRKK